MSVYRGYFLANGVDPAGLDRYIIVNAPNRDGTGFILSEDVDGERVVEVDGVVRWEGAMKSGGRTPFDFTWLRQTPGDGVVTIRCPDGVGQHSIKYSVTKVPWDESAMRWSAPTSMIEGIGIVSAINATASGDYLVYRTPHPHSAGRNAAIDADGIWWHSRAAKWDTMIVIRARVLVNSKAANSQVVLTGATSVFGDQITQGAGRIWSDPPGIGTPNSAFRKPREGFDFSYEYNGALDKWFDTSEDLGNLSVTLGGILSNESGTTVTIPRTFHFPLPGG